MPVIVVGTEKNFAALRPRLLSGKVSTAARREVADAIAAANPHVDLNALAPGTVLTVPDLQHVSMAGEASLDAASKLAIVGVSDGRRGSGRRTRSGAPSSWR